MSINNHRPVLTDEAEEIINHRLYSSFNDELDVADLAVRACLTCDIILDGGDEIADHLIAHMETPA